MKEITEQILSGDGIAIHSNQHFYFMRPLFEHMGFPDEWVPLIVRFLEILATQAKEYYEILREYEPNYEELYYLARQISDAESWEYPNPAVMNFVEQCKRDPRIQEALCGSCHFLGRKYSLGEIAKKTCSYIQDNVQEMLGGEPGNLTSLHFLEPLITHPSVAACHLFTLNHDIYLERVLNDAGIPFADGFTKINQSLQQWEMESYDRFKGKVKVYKLHGSVNWRHIVASDNEYFLGKYDASNARYPVDSQGRKVLPVPVGGAEFLVGTTNKMHNYLYAEYLQLMMRFFEVLNESTCLIISGYGFGDRGITARIDEWFEGNSENRIVLIHKHPENVLAKGQSRLFWQWSNHVKKGRIILIKKWIEEITDEDVLVHLHDESGCR